MSSALVWKLVAFFSFIFYATSRRYFWYWRNIVLFIMSASRCSFRKIGIQKISKFVTVFFFWYPNYIGMESTSLTLQITVKETSSYYDVCMIIWQFLMSFWNTLGYSTGPFSLLLKHLHDVILACLFKYCSLVLKMWWRWRNNPSRYFFISPCFNG